MKGDFRYDSRYESAQNYSGLYCYFGWSFQCACSCRVLASPTDEVPPCTRIGSENRRNNSSLWPSGADLRSPSHDQYNLLYATLIENRLIRTVAIVLTAPRVTSRLRADSGRALGFSWASGRRSRCRSSRGRPCSMRGWAALGGLRRWARIPPLWTAHVTGDCVRNPFDEPGLQATTTCRECRGTIRRWVGKTGVLAWRRPTSGW